MAGSLKERWDPKCGPELFKAVVLTLWLQRGGARAMLVYADELRELGDRLDLNGEKWEVLLRYIGRVMQLPPHSRRHVRGNELFTLMQFLRYRLRGYGSPVSNISLQRMVREIAGVAGIWDRVV
jgi:hypothetical protein